MVLICRHRQINGLPRHLSQHVSRVDERQAEQAHQTPHAVFIDLDPGEHVVQNAAGLRIQPDMPDPVIVRDLAVDLDAHRQLQEMRNPALQHAAQGIQRRLAMVEPQHQIKVFAARPIDLLVVLAQHIKVNTALRHAALLEQLADQINTAGDGLALDGFVIGRHDRTVFEEGDFLGPKQHLGGAYL